MCFSALQARKGQEDGKASEGTKSLAKIYTIFTHAVLSEFSCSFGCKKQKKDKNCVLGQQCTGQNPEKRENTHLLENHD